MSVYLSTGAFRSRRLGEVLDIASREGFCRIELSSGLEYHPDNVDTVRRRQEEFAFLVHNYFPPLPTPLVLNLASPDAENREASLRFARHAVDLCAELGCPFYSVHAGFALPLRAADLGNPYAQLERMRGHSGSGHDAYGLLVESVVQLTRHARSKGLRLLVENNVVAPELAERGGSDTLPLATPEEICRFMRDVGCPEVGLLLDTGHAAVTATALGFSLSEFIGQVGEHVGCLHLSDNSGRSDENLAFDRAAWFAPYLAQFRGLPAVVEAYNLTVGQMHEQVELVGELMA